MELVQQQSGQNYNNFQQNRETQITFKQQLEKKVKQIPSFRKPFQKFCNRTKTQIKIILFRFLVVVCIYLKSDWLLVSDENGLILPWNAMVFFLATVIEIIVLIRNCILIKFLNKQKQKLIQIQEKMQEGIQPNIILQAAPYEYYLSDHQLTKYFKCTHQGSHCSLFRIIKCLHSYCIFLITGFMALRQQKNHATIIQYGLLWLFLASIYYTTFQMDFSVLQMSQGPYRQISEIQQHINNISVKQAEKIQNTMKLQGRTIYIAFSVVGCFMLVIKILVDFNISILLLFELICLAFQFINFGLQRYIFKKLPQVISNIPRQKINPYYIISQTLNLNNRKKYFKVFYRYLLIIFSLQRFSIFFMYMAMSRQVQSIFNFIICYIILFLLFYFQRIKIKIGDFMKLLQIEGQTFKMKKYVNKNQQNAQYQYQCSICLQQIQQNQHIKILPCSDQHIFHFQCIELWLKQKNQCPLCRYELQQYK